MEKSNLKIIDTMRRETNEENTTQEQYEEYPMSNGEDD